MDVLPPLFHFIIITHVINNFTDKHFGLSESGQLDSALIINRWKIRRRDSKGRKRNGESIMPGR